jgi:hypothetical protein
VPLQYLCGTPACADNSIGTEGGKALAESLQVQGVAFWLASHQKVLAFAQVKETLDLRGNYLKALPAKVLQLMHLETLDLSNNHLHTLPSEVGQLKHLETLDLSNNHLRTLPSEVGQLMHLETLDLSNNHLHTLPCEVGQLTCLHTLKLDNNSLEKLPIVELISNPALGCLDCNGNKKLSCPPPEIVNQGGKAVVHYLRLASPQAGGVVTRHVELFMVGNGESGKTSVLAMLKNGKAERIHEDQRTVGINLMDLDLSEEGDGLVFRTKDLAGQSVYALSNQFFLVARAIYVLVWRIVAGGRRGEGHEGHSGEVGGERDSADGESARELVKEMVSTWLDNLQVRVPGASVLVVVTHVDVATAEEIDEQCRVVQATVQRKVSESREDEKVTGIPSLSVWDAGSSLRVNCLEGTGAEELKRALIHKAHELPYWKEIIPGAFALLKVKIEELNLVNREHKPWISWEEYAKIARECGVKDAVELRIVTRYLHDTGVLKFFGKFPSDEGNSHRHRFHRPLDRHRFHPRGVASHHRDYHRRQSNDDDDLLSVARRQSNDDDDLLSEAPFSSTPRGRVSSGLESVIDTVFIDTVFIDSAWIIDTLKGLIRHCRQLLFDFFQSEQTLDRQIRSIWKHRIQRLVSHGVIHAALLPFLWPTGDGSELSRKFWTWAKATSQEVDLWPRPVASTRDEYDRIVALLTGFDVIQCVDEEEYFAPVLVPASRQYMDARAFAHSDLAVHKRVLMAQQPLSFFTKLVVKVWSGRLYSHVDFSPTGAAFYGRGLKTQMFIFCKDIEVAHQDGTHSCRSVVHLDLFTSTMGHMNMVEEALKELFRFFPGVSGLARSSRSEASGPLKLLTTPRLESMNTTAHSRTQEPIQVQIIAATPANLSHPPATSTFASSSSNSISIENYITVNRRKESSLSESLRNLILSVDEEGRDPKDVLNIKVGSSGQWTASYTGENSQKSALP